MIKIFLKFKKELTKGETYFKILMKLRNEGQKHYGKMGNNMNSYFTKKRKQK
jgi:hypothetical protein